MPRYYLILEMMDLMLEMMDFAPTRKHDCVPEAVFDTRNDGFNTKDDGFYTKSEGGLY